MAFFFVSVVYERAMEKCSEVAERSNVSKDSFVIYPSIAESILELPPKLRLEVYDALMHYGMTDVVPDGLSPVARGFIIAFAGGIDGAKRRREANIENGKKGAIYGHLGGRPRKPPETPNKPLNVNGNEKGKGNIKKSFLRHEYTKGELNNMFTSLENTDTFA